LSMTGKVQLHVESFRSLRIEMVFCPLGPNTDSTAGQNCKGMADGSAFIYRLDGRDHLVTARHNVTGRHWLTNACLGEYQTEPTHLRVMFFAHPPEQWTVDVPGDGSRLGNVRILLTQHLVPLLGEDWQPIWKQHPRLGADMDVAVVPFNAPADSMVMPWERSPERTPPEAAPWPQLAAGDDVFIVGYPYRIAVGPLFPLWMRGTVASDPFFGYQTASNSYPCWLIDARTRSGQSGSPVIRYIRAGTVATRNDGIVGRSINPDSDLLGVYSGRTSDESDIGFVWPLDEVDEICRDGVPGRI
jgi:hypothetical protein